MQTVYTPETLNEQGTCTLPGFLGMVVTSIDDHEIRAELPIRQQVMALNGYLHAGSLVTVADTCCGYGSITKLPEGATGFTTIELKSNHLGTAREGTVDCVATAAHLGRSTHVWDAKVTHRETGRTLALFRCTQMILYPK